MKKILFLSFFLLALIFIHMGAEAQCAMCTKTASQLGEKPALGMNQGILYLMGAPFMIVGVIAFRWWKNQSTDDNAAQ
jgi:hypothetical protein